MCGQYTPYYVMEKEGRTAKVPGPRQDRVVRRGHLCRDDVWTAELAVGSVKFVDHVRRQSGYAPILKDENNMLGEQPAPYGPPIDGGNMVDWGF